MNHGSLFTGIGGFDLAAEWLGWNNIFQVENDEWCRQVLRKNFPTVKKYVDIKNFKPKKYENTIDVISGGLPCQPFSTAGKRIGQTDNRWLWPEMLMVVQAIKPSFVVCENVVGIINMALDQVLSDLENSGYVTETFIIPACALNAPHRRDRVWVVAYKLPGEVSPNATRKRRIQATKIFLKNAFKAENKPKPIRTFSDNGGWEFEPGLGGVCDGIPQRLDRLKGLGNAIVPQVALEIFRVINQIKQ